MTTRGIDMVCRAFILIVTIPIGLNRPSELLGDDRRASEPLVTDRPDFTESTDTIPKGRIQVESGTTFTYDSERPSRSFSHTAPELLFRVGIVESFELRVGWEGYTWLNEHLPEETRRGRTIYRDERSQGSSDLYLGFKWKILEQEGLRPHFSLIPAITSPSGTIGFSSGDVDPETKLAWSYDLTESLSLAGNVNVAAPSDEKGRFFQAGASISLAVGLTETVGSYFEYFGFYPNTRETDCGHSFNTGLTWLLTNDLQLDWRVGFGLNEEADDFFTGAGLSVRF